MARRAADVASSPVGLLDIGTSKVVCVVLAPGGQQGHNQIVGVGQQRARGVTSGCVLDLDAAEASVRSAVGRAERMAGVQLDRVVATLSCGRLASHRFKAHVPLKGPVSADDVRRLHRAAAEYGDRLDRRVVHWNHAGFRIDETGGIANPVGLSGERLFGSYHAVTADPGAVDNLRFLIERCFLAPDGTVPTPIASGCAVTTADERRRGVLVVDIGAGTTGYARFREGVPIDCGVIPFGGVHITYDIMTEFDLDEREAERIKTLYGTLAVAPSDRSSPLQLSGGSTPPGYDGPPTRADLARVIAHRVDRQLGLLRERIAAYPDDPDNRMPAVLAGGGAMLPGIAHVAADRLQRPVRVGQAPPLPGVATGLAAPQFAAVTGLARRLPSASEHGLSELRPRGYVDRLQRWVLETF